MEKMNTQRVAIYIRVSTEEQASEGFSIDAQRENLTKYAMSEEWTIVDYYTDEGISAKDMKRPELQRMITDIQNRKIDIVLVYRLDRITRSVRDLYQLLDIFEKHDCSFYSRQERFDVSTTMGRAMLGIIGIFAQWERETIAERVYFGQEQMVHEGRRPGAMAPLGYDLVNGKLVVNQEQAAFVRRLFSLYTEFNGMPAIIRTLSSEGIKMNIRTLYYILTNPVYCGKIRWNHRKDGRRTKKDIYAEGDHEPIISVEEFERVQAIRESRKRNGKGATSDFPFSGIAKCGRCGGDFVGASRIREGKGRERFYRCSSKVNYGSCDMPHISESKMEAEFLRRLSFDRKELEKMVVIPSQPKEKSIVDKIEKELAQISARRKRWQLAFANGLIELEELREHIEPDKKREAELREKLNNLPKARTPVFTKEEFIEQIVQIRELWPYIDDYMAKKEFLQNTFESIVFNTEAKPGKKKFRVEIVNWSIK